MKADVNRREFLRYTARATAGLTLGAVAGCELFDTAKPEPLYRISLAQWSLHKTIRAKKLDNLDFAKTSKELGIEAVEYVNQFFKDKAKDKKYLGEMKKRAADHGVKSLLIMVDGEGRLGDPDEQKRKQAIENHYQWVDAAKFLGGHSIRVNAGSGGTYDEQIGRAADGLRRVTEYAAERDMNILVENHGGLSSNGAWLAAVMRKVGHERCGTLPDFGNFRIGQGERYDAYKGVKELMPFAKAVSAKSYDFDQDGNDTTTDYLRMMKIVIGASYRGWVGIEYEGSAVSEREGIRLTRDLLMRVRDELAAAAEEED